MSLFGAVIADHRDCTIFTTKRNLGNRKAVHIELQRPTIPYLTTLQKLVAGVAVAAFAWVLWKQYLEGSLSDASSIFGFLAITGLLILVLRSPPRSLVSSRGAAKASPAGREHKSPKASIPAMYTSARNLAEKFFQAAGKSVRDRNTAEQLKTNRAHLVRIFAYLGPKFVLNMKVEGFEHTRAARELRTTASEGFQAVEELEENAFRDMVGLGGFEWRRSPTEAAAFLSQGMVERFDKIFAECSDNLIQQAEFPLDPLFKHFNGLAPLARDDPRARHKVYQPLFRDFYAIWSAPDLSGLDLLKATNSTPQSKAIGIEPFEGDLATLTGTAYLAWFIANPNGPTAFVIGSVQTECGERLFYRSMHFTGQQTWSLGDTELLLSECGGDTGEVIELGVDRAQRHFSTCEEDAKAGFNAIPSFVLFNGDHSVALSFLALVGINLAEEDWGRELFLRQKYEADFFGRAGDEAREAYERLKADPSTDQSVLRIMWLRHSGIPTFANWVPSSHAPARGGPAQIAEWWKHASDMKTVAHGLVQFEAMWEGASGLIADVGGTGFTDNRRHVRYAELVRFFEAFQLPVDP